MKEEVALRVKELENQQEAIEQYIHHNTDTLKNPLNNLSLAVNEFKGETQLHLLLRVSHAELNQVITSINQALQSETKLDRSVLNKRAE